MKVKYYNPEILEELKVKEPQQFLKASKKFPKIFIWLERKDYPTINQLIELGKIFNIPFGYFFLKNIPERSLPLPHYRTIEIEEIYKPSPELLDTIYLAQRMQFFIKDLLIQWGHNKLDFAGKFQLGDPVENIREELLNILKLNKDWQEKVNTWSEAFSLLIKKTEDAGIFVLLNGIVGNNTKRKLLVDEFRGFVLFDEIAPFIFINNNDSVAAKIFTLIHEIVHILIGKSASFDLRDFQPANNQIELYCNQSAAEFLVPKNILQEKYKETKGDVNVLAKHFKVSEIVILRRLLDNNLITKELFYNLLNDYRVKEKKLIKQEGGSFYNTVRYRLSKRFLNMLILALKQNIILYREATKVTKLKLHTLEKLIGHSLNK